MPNEIAYYDDENGNRSYFADDTAREQISQLNTNIKDFKNLFVSSPSSTSATYTFSIPANAIAELTAVSGTNLAQYYIIAVGTTLRIIKHTDDVTGLNVTLDSIRGGVYNYTVTVPAYALSVAYRIS